MFNPFFGPEDYYNQTLEGNNILTKAFASKTKDDFLKALTLNKKPVLVSTTLEFGLPCLSDRNKSYFTSPKISPMSPDSISSINESQLAKKLNVVQNKKYEAEAISLVEISE